MAGFQISLPMAAAPLSCNRRRASSSPRALAELLEPRQLLTAASADSILAAVPQQDSGQLTSAGLLLAPTRAAGQTVTPDYQLLDSSPQLTSAGTLIPFSSAAPVGFSPAQIRHAYGFDSISIGNVTGSGAGQTIAIVDAYNDPNIAADLATFDTQYNLPAPPSFSVVNESGGATLPANAVQSATGGWALEESLDVEWAHAIAPKANILLVEASSSSDADMVQNAVNYARSVPGVSVVSMSWGEDEWSTESAEDSYFTTPAGHTGVTFVAATGDHAAPGDYPAFSPEVLAVGGTQLSADSSGNYQSEIAWSDSGGGISQFELQPAYQTGVVTQSTSFRTTPDIAFDASPSSGVAVCDSYDLSAAAPWIQVGGTSMAAPCWSGLIAIVNQFRGGGNSPLDGFSQTLPKLYSLSTSVFHDITSGSNGFSAGAGYDLATGRGSPLANDVVADLLTSAPLVVAASPTGTVVTIPTSMTFTFDQAMDQTSFSIAADVDSFTGPAGVNELSAITSFSWTSSTTLKLNLSLASVQGTYTLTLGPQILSTGEVPMDQNANGTAGESSDTYTQSFTVDTTPAPSAPLLQASCDTGISSSDGITSNNNSAGKPLTFTIAGVTSGDTVQLLSNGSVVGSATAAGTSVSIAVASGTILTDGTYSFTAQQTPSGGQTSIPSAAQIITVETATPATPAAPPLTAASDTGVSDTDDITDDLTPTFTIAVATPYFRFYRGSTLLSSSFQSGATFTLTTQPTGTQSYTVVAVDAAGNASLASVATSVTFSTAAPPAPPTPTLDSSSDTGISNSDDLTNSTAPIFDVTASQAGEIGVDVDGAAGGTLRVSGPGTYAVSGINPSSRTFSTAASYPAGDSPWAVTTADINGDALADIVIPNNSAQTITVLLNQGNGTFGSPITTPVTGYTPIRVATGDFNDDGHTDLIVATDTNYVLLLLGNGNGTFSAPQPILTGGQTEAVAVGDFNHDGNLDFAVSGSLEQSISVFLGNGNGTFQARQITYLSSTPSELYEADFNGDEIPDLAVIDGASYDQIQILIGNGNGTFANTSTIQSLSNITGIAGGDFNGDGKLDLVATDDTTDDMALLLGNGNGTFQAPRLASTNASNLADVVVGDFNGDGYLDAATVSNAGSNSAGHVSICYGDGAGDLAAGVLYAVGENPVGVATADFNNDGKADLVSADYFSEDADVLLGTGGALAPGTHTITAWAESVAGVISASSPSLTITIQITGPTASVTAAPAFTNGYVDTASITFSEAVTGFTIADLSLTSGNGPNLLDGSETLATSDDIHWTVNGLGPLNLVEQQYTLSVNPSGIIDAAGNALAASASTTWQTIDSQAPAIVGSATDTSFFIRPDSTDRYLQVWLDTTPTSSPTPTYSYAVSPAGPIIINATAANVAFTIDFSAAAVIASAILSINGAAGSTDALTMLLPNAGSNLTVTDQALSLAAAGAISYTNLSSITINGGSGNDTVNQQTHTGPPIAFLPGAGSDVLNIDSGTYTLTSADSNAPNLTINDFSLLQVAASAPGAGIFAPTVGALNLATSGTYGAGNAVLLSSDTPSDRTVLILNSLTIPSDAGQSLDLSNNDLIVHNGNFNTINSMVGSSASDGTWQGSSGIGSSAAANDPTRQHALGVMANADGSGKAIFATFDDQGVSATDVLIRYTLVGDANLDGSVNAADYAFIDNGFNLRLTGWRNGDFNYDGAINGDDYSLIDNTFDEQDSIIQSLAIAPALKPQSAATATISPASQASSVVTTASTVSDSEKPAQPLPIPAAVVHESTAAFASPFANAPSPVVSLDALLDSWSAAGPAN